MPKRRRKIVRRRKRTVALARRSNPTVPILFANPRRRRRVRRRRPRANPVRRRRRRTTAIVLRRSNPLANPRRRRRRPRLFRRRRGNPFRRRGGALSVHSIGSFVRLAAFGALGFMVARFSSYLYRTYLESSVVGTDATQTWRQTLSEALRLAAMGAATWAMERAMRSANLGTPSDRQAFMIGGLTETGRTALAVAIKKLAPANSFAQKFGLDGMGAAEAPEAFVDEAGRTWVLQGDGQYHLLGELEEDTSFMGELETSESFMGGDPKYIYAQ